MQITEYPSDLQDIAAIAKDQVTIVVPVKDEECGISMVIDELLTEGYHNILVVDGYSTDKTFQMVKKKNGIRFISQHGGGKTGAVKTAIEKVTTPYMLVIDGDFTYPAKDIERLLNHRVNYVQVIGVRDRKNICFTHRLGNSVITRTFNFLFGTNLSDVCSGMYLLNVEVAKQLELNSKGFITEVEIAAQTAAEHSITEVPIGYRQRVGKGKLTGWNGFSILLAVARLARKYNPILLFSMVAGMTIIPAFAVLGWVLFQQFTTGIWHSGWALIGTALLLFALQNISVASISAMLKRMEQRMTLNIKKAASNTVNPNF